MPWTMGYFMTFVMGLFKARNLYSKDPCGLQYSYVMMKQRYVTLLDHTEEYIS